MTTNADELEEQAWREMEAIRGKPTIDAVLDQRGKRYGKFKDHASATQAIKAAIKHGLINADNVLADDQQEALDMISHKIGRIVNGDPDYADSWIDIAGYAQLVADRLQGRER